ncbi:hypothetical protein BGZ49_002389, partial [Haplosporangium sp. Z 27]
MEQAKKEIDQELGGWNTYVDNENDITYFMDPKIFDRDEVNVAKQNNQVLEYFKMKYTFKVSLRQV